MLCSACSDAQDDADAATTDGSSGHANNSGNVDTGKAETGSDPTETSSAPTTGASDSCATHWCPSPKTSWQWQLSETIDTGVEAEVFDIDLFDAPQEVIDTLHGAGQTVICYFSAGSHEDWRPDADEFPPMAIGDPLDEWPGERWIDHRVPEIRTVMAARLDLAVTKGCDAVEPDNVDGYVNATGFDLSAADQLDYNRWLAEQAHVRGLSIGLKNDVDQISELVDDFDWALNEECMAYDECETAQPFIDAGKAVFHVEYVDDPADGQPLADEVCPTADALSFSTLIKTWDLTAWRIAC